MWWCDAERPSPLTSVSSQAMVSCPLASQNHTIVKSSLEIDRHTKIETATLGKKSGIDALIKHAIAGRYFGVTAKILRNGKHVVGFSPNGKSLQPGEGARHLIG